MAKDFAKSKCFIKTDNGYEEITYAELLRREEADSSYKGRRFLPLHGMLMEVPFSLTRTGSEVGSACTPLAIGFTDRSSLEFATR